MSDKFQTWKNSVIQTLCLHLGSHMLLKKIQQNTWLQYVFHITKLTTLLFLLLFPKFTFLWILPPFYTFLNFQFFLSIYSQLMILFWIFKKNKVIVRNFPIFLASNVADLPLSGPFSSTFSLGYYREVAPSLRIALSPLFKFLFLLTFWGSLH